MKRSYETNEIRHFLVWLAAYLILSIVVINLGAAVGLSLHAAAVIPLGILSLTLYLYLRRTGIDVDIGLGTPAAVSGPRLWFYLPLLVLVAFPLFTGVRDDLTAWALLVIIGHAVFVGFLEEVLMRGLLLKALLRAWRPVWAILLAAATFGVGHVASLAIGQSGGDTVLQILNATIVGLLFTLVVVTTGNLHAAIVAHILYNAIAQISNVTDSAQLLIPGVVMLVLYGAWLYYGAGLKQRIQVLDARRDAPADESRPSQLRRAARA